MTEEDTGETPHPEVGEVCALNGLSWTPWVIVTRVEHDSEGNLLARFAVLDKMDDDVLTPVPDSWQYEVERTIGDRDGRREFAKAVDTNDEIGKRWCRVDRLDHLNEPHIQGAPPQEREV